MTKRITITGDQEFIKKVTEHCKGKGVTVAEAGRALFLWWLESPDFVIKKSEPQLVRKEAA